MSWHTHKIFRNPRIPESHIHYRRHVCSTTVAAANKVVWSEITDKAAIMDEKDIINQRRHPSSRDPILINNSTIQSTQTLTPTPMALSKEQAPSPAYSSSSSSSTEQMANNGLDGSNEPKDLEAGKEAKDPFLIEFDGPNDPMNPMNWSTTTKVSQTALLASLTFVVTFASSVFSVASKSVAEKFGVSQEVTVLGVSLFVMGFALGPICWGPLSELYGRKPPLLIGFFIFAVFQIPVAVAQNLETIMLCRFFGGLFASAPLAIIGGAFVDFWGPVERGVAMCFFSAATFLGPVFGPIIGGFMTQSYLGWRWTEYLTAIMAFFFLSLAFLFQKESYAPRILQAKAKKIRLETKQWATRSKLDEKVLNLHEIINVYLARPIKMIFLEPILMLLTLYMAIVYGVLYLSFEAYPIAFQEDRGWQLGVGSLPFLSITIGVLCGGSLIIWTTKTRFQKKLKENNGRVVPEERLPPMMVGAIVFPAGLFWFAWTSSKNITWVPQAVSGIFIGMGILIIFLQGLNYIIDVYGPLSNSAIAANTILRSGFGAGFPLFAQAMFHTLGVNWAMSLLGFIAVAMAPAPFLFYKYGARIRGMSKFGMPVNI